MNSTTVLLIDPDEAFTPQLLVGASLGEEFRITRKATLADGLFALQQSGHQIVLLNPCLPDAQPAESIKRTIDVARNVPVVIIVNAGDAGRIRPDLNAEILPYVVKGCRCEALVRTMRYAIESRQIIANKENTIRQVLRKKAQLTAHLSHEFRNALACIHQFGNILIDGLAGEMSPEQREYVGIMVENGRRIRDVLQASLEADSTPLIEREQANEPARETANQ